MDDDNITKQADEVEALSSIYGDDWQTVDEAERTYCIHIKHDENYDTGINLQVTFTPGYPSNSPPLYQLNAPWLRGDDRREIQNSLEDIYSENVGESITYLWVEAIRSFLQNITEQGTPSGGVNENDCSLGDEIDPAVLLASCELSLSREECQEDIECPEVYHGDTVADRRSVFQPHAATISNKTQVKKVLDKLCENKKIANATHNIYAYRIAEGNKGTLLTGCYDDGETHAGSRMLHLLTILDVVNVMVVVTRWYGGVHLGPDRFKHINNCTRTILDQCGYLTSTKGDKKTGHKTSKKR